MLSLEELDGMIAETVRLMVKGSDRALGLTEGEYHRYRRLQGDLWSLTELLARRDGDGGLSDGEATLLVHLLDEQDAWGNTGGRIIWNADAPKTVPNRSIAPKVVPNFAPAGMVVASDDVGDDGLGDIVEVPEETLLRLTDGDEWIRRYGDTLWRDAERVNPVVPVLRRVKRVRKSATEAVRRIARGEPAKDWAPRNDAEWNALKEKVRMNDAAWLRAMDRWYDPRSWGLVA